MNSQAKMAQPQIPQEPNISAKLGEQKKICEETTSVLSTLLHLIHGPRPNQNDGNTRDEPECLFDLMEDQTRRLYEINQMANEILRSI